MTSWLPVPYLVQDKPGWCLPACAGMIAAYWGQPLLQDDIANWLGATGVGVPARRIQRLATRGFNVVYRTGSISELETWLKRNVPCILFVHTGELPYWNIDTPHAVVLVGLTPEQAFLLDPAFEEVPVTVSPEDLLLAWSFFDYTYAAMMVETVS